MSSEILYVFGSYLVGSVLGGYLIAKFLNKEDFLKKDLPGASGTLRQIGLKAGLFVAAFDILKGSLVIFAGEKLGFNLNIIVLAALATVIGHNWSVFFKFQGGGGLATSVGILAVLLPKMLAIGLAFGVPVALFYRKTFLKGKMTPAPLGAIVSFPVLIFSSWYFNRSKELLILAFSLAIISLVKLIQWKLTES